jgi:hypothetical protein
MSIATLLISLGVFALFFVFLSVNLLLKPKGEFRGTCSSNNPLLKARGVDCATCPSKLNGKCANDEPDEHCDDHEHERFK